MAAKSTLSSAERRQLHRNINTLRRRGWTLRQIAREMELSIAALSNMMRSTDRGTSDERAAKVAELVSTEATPPARVRRGGRGRRRKHAVPTTTIPTVHSEIVLPAATIEGISASERRKVFAEQLEATRAHISKAHASLRATIESGSATVVTQPGVQRILDMLQQLHDELAAT